MPIGIWPAGLSGFPTACLAWLIVRELQIPATTWAEIETTPLIMKRRLSLPLLGCCRGLGLIHPADSLFRSKFRNPPSRELAACLDSAIALGMTGNKRADGETIFLLQDRVVVAYRQEAAKAMAGVASAAANSFS